MLGMLYLKSFSDFLTEQVWSLIIDGKRYSTILNTPTQYKPVETFIDRDRTRPSSAQWGDPHLQTHQWPATITMIGWWECLWSELRNLFHRGGSSSPPSSSWMEMRTKENSHGSSWTGSVRWRTDDGDSISRRARRPPAYGKEMKSIENQWDGNEILSARACQSLF